MGQAGHDEASLLSPSSPRTSSGVQPTITPRGCLHLVRRMQIMMLESDKPLRMQR